MTFNEAKPVIDGVSIPVTVASLIGYLPALAAAATFVWSMIRIYETKTVQKMLPCNWRKRENTKR